MPRLLPHFPPLTLLKFGRICSVFLCCTTELLQDNLESHHYPSFEFPQLFSINLIFTFLFKKATSRQALQSLLRFLNF